VDVALEVLVLVSELVAVALLVEVAVSDEVCELVAVADDEPARNDAGCGAQRD